MRGPFRSLRVIIEKRVISPVPSPWPGMRWIDCTGWGLMVPRRFHPR